MKIEADSAGMFILHASDQELTIINNVLHEICSGFMHDFEARFGGTEDEAKALLESVSHALDEAR